MPRGRGGLQRTAFWIGHRQQIGAGALEDGAHRDGIDEVRVYGERAGTEGASGLRIVTAEKEGLLIAISPTVDAREMGDVFRVNFIEKGVLPVLLVAENRSEAVSFIVPKENMAVTNRDTREAAEGQRAPVTSETAAAVLGAVGAVTLRLPFLIAGMKMVSDAQIIEHNLVPTRHSTAAP